MINISDLAKEINEALATYTNEVVEEIDASAEKRAKEAVKLLRSKSPVGATKQYRKGWRAKKINGRWIVYNKTRYQLTHLLEKGHAKVGGGRVKAYPHIAPVEEKIVEGFIKDVEGAIKI